MVSIHNRVVFCHKEEWNSVICSKAVGSEGQYIKWNKPETERLVMNVLSYADAKKNLT